MNRRKDWARLGTTALITMALAVAFVATVNSARPGRAQETPPPALLLANSSPTQAREAMSAGELGEAFTAASEAVRASVVFIQAIGTGERGTAQAGSGSGFIITTDGYIITNNHVVENAEHLTVRLLDRREFPAEIVGRDANTDIAVLKIDASDLPAATLGNSDSAQIGEWVLAIGNPLGFTFTVTAGIVSARGRLLPGLQNSNYSIQDFIQTDAAINPGNSGGPLVNIRGEVVGVNSALASSTGLYSGYGFAIPINLGYQVAEMLISGGRVTRSLLGVSIQDATPEDAEYVGLDSIYGVTVQSFSGTGSPAERAGLALGDVIVALDDMHVSYTAQLQQTVGFKHPGDVVQVTVQRAGGTRRTFPVELIAQDLTPVASERTSDKPHSNDLNDPSGTGLGVTLEPMTRSELAQLPPELHGPIVRRVNASGPSANGRLGAGWIITQAQSQRVRTPEELREVLDGISPGTIVDLRYARVLGQDQNGQVVTTTGVARIRLAEIRH